MVLPLRTADDCEERLFHKTWERERERERETDNQRQKEKEKEGERERQYCATKRFKNFIQDMQ